MPFDGKTVKTINLPTPPEKDIADEVARCDALDMLTLLLQYPSSALVDGLKAGTLQGDILSIGAELGWNEETLDQCIAHFSCVDSESEADTLHRFAKERTRLFDHPDTPAIPLYEDEFVAFQHCGENGRRVRPPRFVNKAASSAEQFYLRGGFKRTSEANIPADCMTTELAFLAALSRERARTLIKGDEREAERLACLRSEFVERHVARWFIPFYTALANEADGFYSGAGSLGLLLFVQPKSTQ